MSRKNPRAVICSQSNFATDYRIHKMAASLRSAGFEVSFLGRSHPHQQRTEDADTHIMKLLFWHGPLFYAEFNLRLFVHLLFARHHDLVVAIDLDSLAGCSLATGLRRQHLLFDSHEYFPEVPEIAHKPFVKWVWNRVQDLFVPFADTCVTVCQSIADIFRQKYGREFFVVRNVPLQGRASAAQSSPSQSSRPFTLLYQGAVNVGRGIEEVILALPQLPDVRFVVVGDGDCFAQVQQLARQTGVAQQVDFVGRKPFDLLTQYMANADLGIVFMQNISLNYYYSLPNRIFDFIQAGLPILGVRFPEIERIVEGQGVGICLSEVSPSAVVQAVRQLQQQPELLQQFRQRMAQLATDLTWENEVAPLMQSLSCRLATGAAGAQ